MNPVILLFLRVGLVAVGWSALSAQAAPVLPSSLDVGKSNRKLLFYKLCYWHSERVELCFGIRFFSKCHLVHKDQQQHKRRR